MKILHVIPSLAGRTGGPATAVLGLSRALVRKGVDVTIYTAEIGSQPLQEELRIKTFKSLGLEDYHFSPDLKQALRQTVSEFDLVHIHGLWNYPALIAGRISKGAGVPYMIRPCGMLDSYCLDHHAFRKRIYYSLFEKQNINAAAWIHFTSEEEKTRSMNAGIQAKTCVISLGVDMEAYLNLPPRGAFRKKNPSLAGKKIILFLGRIHFKKGLDLLIRAFSNLYSKVQDIHCVIAGPDEAGYTGKLKRLVREQGLEDSVTWPGYVSGDEKLSLLRDSDLFCLPSHQENFGLAVTEAMAAELPVVVSDQVNIHQEIKSARAGFVIPCKINELEAALNRLLEDASLRQEMGKNARELVSRRYSWDHVAETMINCYRETIR